MTATTDALRSRLEAIAGEVSTFVEPASPGSSQRSELPLAAPRDAEQAAELLRLAAADGLSLIPLGLGSKAGWCGPAERADFALSTRELAGVVDYEPGDGTVSARAGTRMADLAARVREGGHRLVPDVPRPEGATLGGVVAAGASGVRRLRFGPVRNHVLGVRALLADGSVARSGGQLVKNVTGYDLHRLYCGSHGTLCVLLEASRRLFALPEEERALVAETDDLEAALVACGRARGLALEPEVAAVVGDGAGYRVTIAVSGRAAALDAHLPSVRAVLPDPDAARELSGAEAAGAVALVRDAGLDEDGRWPSLSVATLPSRVGATAEAIVAATRELGAAPPRFVVHPGIASVSAWFEEELAEDVALELAPVLADPVGPAGPAATVRWPGTAHEARSRLASTAPAPPIARRLRDALDPDGVFARGRHPGGL
jgi:glycolate oxidase FAD binding subunit